MVTDATVDRRTGAIRPVGVVRVVLVSPVRLYREGLAHILSQEESVRVVGVSARAEELDPVLRSTQVDIVLFDLAVEGGLSALQRINQCTEAKILVLGLGDEDGPILACARAGIAGYVTKDSTLMDLTARIREAAAGEFRCSPRLAAVLLRNLAVSAPWRTSTAGASLTTRELQIVQLIDRTRPVQQGDRPASHNPTRHREESCAQHPEKLSVQRRADAVRAVRSLDSYAGAQI